MRKIVFIGILTVTLSSCDDTLVKSEFTAMGGAVWEKENTVEFTFSEMDSTMRYDMFINIRNDNTFPFNNLFLIAELSSPTGETTRDTLEYQMAQPDGTWLGKGYGSIKENKLWFKENIGFPESGVYTLRIAHAMRKNGSVNGIEHLEGITDVGFEIVKSN
ncbi:gliding motility lipoprotein GldH [Flavobacteriaceae bacterium TP-CH-4]|uniref:Gliding motility lipoprotein GldH n=1 Tax=Pelagihabitans pacificus TaxID=2696054 RepID=A0A967E6G6_9FLAO|nr:gliding motility lipoprotein GldH [Pelagihabitans pacificus]NHF59149.1 gliding motility lipoprotein GldH [Pelagihabitans pacificus]